MIEDGSLRIGKFFGIPLKLHWTFGLIVIYVMFNVILNDSFWFLWYIAMLFISVILHEYGHALTAKRFSINTRDIILSPIGGVARLENLPDKPWQEMLVAIAGPLVNLFIVLIIVLGLTITGKYPYLPENLIQVNSNSVPEFFRWVIIMNFSLFLFNLIPAFPMDGGRILRAGLAIKLGKPKATKIASIVGRVLAIGFIIFGILLHEENSLMFKYSLIFIGFVIFFMATREMKDTIVRENLSKLFVKDFMRSAFTLIHAADFMCKPIELFRRTGESNFVVINGLNEIVGTMPSIFLTEAIKKKAYDEKVEQWISPAVQDINENETLLTAYEKMNTKGAGILLIVKDEKIEGVIDREAIQRAMNHEG